MKTARKIGFFAALAMLLGSVVGIGIFFKNGTVFRSVEYNGLSALIAWIVGGLLALFAAISFSEIGSVKTNKVHGLAGWAEKFGGKKFGYLTRLNFSVFYFAFMNVTLGAFVSEAFFQFLISTGAMDSQPPIWAHAILGVTFSGIAAVSNRYSIKGSGRIATITTILKFIPLILAFVIGIAFANTHHLTPDVPNNNYDGMNIMNHGSMSFTGILAALPAILFAYDAFLNVGTLSAKTKGGTKTVSKVVVIGMISVILLYSLIAIAAIFHGGSIEAIITDSLSNSKGLKIFIYFFIFISAYGVLNGMTAGYITSLEQAYDTNTVFGSKTLKSKFGENKGFFVLFAINLSLVMMIVYIPAISINSDAYIDAVTNFPTLFFFGMYATVILLYIFKREKVESNKINNILFKVASWIAVIGILFIVIYQIFYGFTISAFINPNNPSHAGLFATFRTMNMIELFGVFAMMATLFISLPLINRFLVKKYEKHDVIENTQV